MSSVWNRVRHREGRDSDDLRQSCGENEPRLHFDRPQCQTLPASQPPISTLSRSLLGWVPPSQRACPFIFLLLTFSEEFFFQSRAAPGRTFPRELGCRTRTSVRLSSAATSATPVGIFFAQEALGKVLMRSTVRNVGCN